MKIQSVLGACLFAMLALFARDADARGQFYGSPITIIAQSYTLTAGQSVDFTTQRVELGNTTVQAFDWDVVPASGSPSVNVILLQSNWREGPFTEWPQPLGSGTVTNNVTFTTTRGGSPWGLTPSDWGVYRLRNSAAVSVSVTVRAFAQ